MAKEKENKKTKVPTAKKRDKQNLARRSRNRVLLSKIRTSIQKFTSYLKSNDKKNIDLSLKTLYSFIDKSLKHNIFKQNKANRLKASLASKAKKVV